MPIAMSKTELSRLKRWSEPDREEAETVRRREMVKWMDATSKEMTKNWPNSVENVNKRNEELRRARIEAAEQANAAFYKRYVKRQQQEQQRLMHSARDIVFRNKDAPKLLLSAVIESCVQKERIEQIKFQNKLRQMKEDQKKKDDDDIIRKAREWNDLIKVKEKKRFEANKQHQKDILEQAHEVAERNRIEYETELNMQKVDNIKADQEIAALKEFEENFCAAEKARIWRDMESARVAELRRRAELRARDVTDDKLLQVLLRSRARVNKMRIQTENHIKEEKRRILENISSKLESGDAARSNKEHEILLNAVRERDAVEEQRRQSQLARQQASRELRAQQREMFLQDEEQRIHDINTRRQFDIMNRFKNAELYEEYKQKQREEKAAKVKQFRDDTLRLWNERVDREARERAELREFYGTQAMQKIRAADTKVLLHAAELLEEAGVKDRPDYPIRKAIDRYCKLYRLYPMPDLPHSMQEHFKLYAPTDGSTVDPGYLPPRPQPPAVVGEEPTRGTNGLRDPQKPNTSNPSTNKEEHVDDYKRMGRADGLQRRNVQADATLPPISVPRESCPCTTNK